MITLEQIQLLDKKVKDAIDLINRLREENRSLNGTLAAHELTIARLEEELSMAKTDSDRIEEGFNEALSRLDLARSEEDIPNQREDTSSGQESDEGITAEEEPAGEATEAQADGESANEETEPEPSIEEEAFQESDVTEEPVEDADRESIQETMQFEEEAEESADDPASEEPDIDEGIPLTPDTVEEESQVNHSEQQEDEESRSPQDLDIF